MKRAIMQAQLETSTFFFFALRIYQVNAVTLINKVQTPKDISRNRCEQMRSDHSNAIMNFSQGCLTQAKTELMNVAPAELSEGADENARQIALKTSHYNHLPKRS